MSFFRKLRRGDAQPPIDDYAAHCDLKPIPDQSGSSDVGVAASISGAENACRSGPNPRYMFVAYSPADKEFAARLIEDLRTHHFSPWIDSSVLTPRVPDYEQVIREAIPNLLSYRLDR